MSQSKQSVYMKNDCGRIYHLRLHPEDVADTVILVGDPDRSDMIAEHFDVVHVEASHREFRTVTGEFHGKRLTVLSTGIGAGGVEVAINELDALVNIDPSTGKPLDKLTSLNLIRFGTTGALQPDTAIGSVLVSEAAFAFDGLIKFYNKDTDPNIQPLQASLEKHFANLSMVGGLYAAGADRFLVDIFSDMGEKGITFTCNGFYAPQARALRLPIRYPDLLDQAQAFSYEGTRITNLEMETAVIYGLADQLGHKACSVSVAVANRHHNASGSYKQVVEDMLDEFLDRVSKHLRHSD